LELGIGFAWNSFLHCLAVHRAQVFDFFRRALSVEIPVPAYICRWSFERSIQAILACRVGVQADLCQIVLQLKNLSQTFCWDQLPAPSLSAQNPHFRETASSLRTVQRLPLSLHIDRRNSIVYRLQIVRRQFYARAAKILFEPAQLRCTGNRDDPRLLGK
jgi:hypothetical protein